MAVVGTEVGGDISPLDPEVIDISSEDSRDASVSRCSDEDERPNKRQKTDQDPSPISETTPISQPSASPPQPAPTEPHPGTEPSQPSAFFVYHQKPSFNFEPYVPIIKSSADNQQIIIDPRGVVDYYWTTAHSAVGERLLGEILPEDAIVDTPSLVTPLLLKKRTTWPTTVTNDEDDSNNKPETKSSNDSDKTNNDKEKEASTDEAQDKSDDIKIVKVVDGRQPPPSSRYQPVEDYVKSTVIVSLTNNSRLNSNKTILAIQDYNKSSVGELLLGIGLSRVNEYVLDEEFRKTSSKIKRGASELIHRWESVRSELGEAVKSNSSYKLAKIYECQRCPFKADSLTVLEGHLESPHRDHRRDYICNWCNFRTKDASQMTLHNIVAHKKRCQIEKFMSPYCCSYCPFECKAKRKFTSHFTKCEQSFQPYRNQVYDDDGGRYDYPAITSKFITKEDVKTYESTLKALRLAAYNPHQIKVSNYGQSGQPVLVLSRRIWPQTKITTPSGPKPATDPAGILSAATPFSGPTSVAFVARGDQQTSMNKSNNSESSHRDSSQLLNFIANQTISETNLPQKATIIKHPRVQSPFVNGMCVIKTAQNIMMPPQTGQQNLASNGTSALNNKSNSLVSNQLQTSISIRPKSTTTTTASSSSSPSSTSSPALAPNSGNTTFISCEMCDSYIENFNQFRNHMQWVHKVKIHQKMSERPPLMCQKCPWRFYTDHGLERHLLGVHSLVTPNLRDQASKDTDSGRCTICGSRFARRLVAHMKDFHKANLKQAQLSYRCTVCSATFSLYRLFENHVYKLHSQDGGGSKKTTTPAKATAAGRTNININKSSIAIAGGATPTAGAPTTTSKAC